MTALSTAFSVVLATTLLFVGVVSNETPSIDPQGYSAPVGHRVSEWYTDPLQRADQAREEAEHVRLEAIEMVIRHEGGFAHHPADPGGPTNYGITKRTARSHGYHGAMRDFTKADALRVYSDLWEASGVAHIDDHVLAAQVFDAYIAHGPRAMRWVTYGERACERLNQRRLSVYRNSRNWATFGRGWERRIRSNLSRCTQ